jgi:hypothetical protein
MKKALFEGLVFDEAGHNIRVAYVGETPTYIVTEDGFNYHVDAARVDDEVLRVFKEQVEQNKDMVGDGMLKMMGRDDLFSKATVMAALRNLDKSLTQMRDTGIPEQARQYLGMMGFKVVINRQGDIVDLNLPASAAPDDEP